VVAKLRGATLRSVNFERVTPPAPRNGPPSQRASRRCHLECGEPLNARALGRPERGSQVDRVYTPCYAPSVEKLFVRQGILFRWDSEKAAANTRRHGVSFEEASEVFFDPFVL